MTQKEIAASLAEQLPDYELIDLGGNAYPNAPDTGASAEAHAPSLDVVRQKYTALFGGEGDAVESRDREDRREADETIVYVRIRGASDAAGPVSPKAVIFNERTGQVTGFQG